MKVNQIESNSGVIVCRVFMRTVESSKFHLHEKHIITFDEYIKQYNTLKDVS